LYNYINGGDGLKIYCEYGEHQVDENEIDIDIGYTVCKDCMKKVENERVKRVEKWFGNVKKLSVDGR
jgi:hypothetical protein